MKVTRVAVDGGVAATPQVFYPPLPAPTLASTKASTTAHRRHPPVTTVSVDARGEQ